MLAKLLLVCLSIFTIECALALSIGELKYKVDARQWLFKYGYEASYNPKKPEKELAEGIKNLQRFADIPVTGLLDDITLKQMAKPRCGHRDPIIRIKNRGRRYVHQGSDWFRTFRENGNKYELKWTLLNNGRSLGYNTVLKVMRDAFRFWQAQTNIDFIEIPKNQVGKTKETEKDNIEILVSFVRGYHNDPYAFDGEGGTLAHAFYPHSNKGLSGDVHFDDAEYYTYKSPQGRNLLWVATHELGHSLGLEHSNVREAVMYPWYTKYKPGFKLHEDDIYGIQSLYGSRTKPLPVVKTTTTTTTTTTPKPSVQPKVDNKRKCPRYAQITAFYNSKRYNQDVAFTTSDRIYFLSSKNKVHNFDRYRYLPKWKIPAKINALFTTKALENRESQIYFAGTKYYVYKDFNFISGPHSIHGSNPLNLKFPTTINHIDGAMTWFRNGRAYFFSGEQYWRYNPTKKRMDYGYPKNIRSAWKGLPGRIDTAYSSGNEKRTFFIVGNRYYKFDDKAIRVNGVYDIKNFLQCDSASSIGNFGVGRISSFSLPNAIP